MEDNPGVIAITQTMTASTDSADSRAKLPEYPRNNSRTKGRGNGKKSPVNEEPKVVKIY